MKRLQGLRVVTKKSQRKKEKKEAKPMKLTMPLRLDGFCRQGDLDRCQVRCGTCVEAGGFENISRLVTYLV